MRDVIVVGAGGGGAVVAKELAQRGLDALQRIDVGVGPEPLHHLTARIPHRHRAGEEGAVAAVLAA